MLMQVFFMPVSYTGPALRRRDMREVKPHRGVKPGEDDALLMGVPLWTGGTISEWGE